MQYLRKFLPNGAKKRPSANVSETKSVTSPMRTAAQVLWLVISDMVAQNPGMTSEDLGRALQSLLCKIQSCMQTLTGFLPLAWRLPLASQPLFTTLAAQKNGVNVFVRILQRYSVRLFVFMHAQHLHDSLCKLPALLSVLLMQCLDSGISDAVTALGEVGADMNMVDEDGKTALIYATQAKHVSLVKALLAAGVNVDPVEPQHYSVLLAAFVAKNAEITKMLLDAKAGSGTEDACTLEKNLLPLAVRSRDTSSVHALLAAKADVESPDMTGSTALMIAAMNGYASLVQMLVDAGAQVDVQGPGHNTALTLAMHQGHMDVVHILMAATARAPPHGGFENSRVKDQDASPMRTPPQVSDQGALPMLSPSRVIAEYDFPMPSPSQMIARARKQPGTKVELVDVEEENGKTVACVRGGDQTTASADKSEKNTTNVANMANVREGHDMLTMKSVEPVSQADSEEREEREGEGRGDTSNRKMRLKRENGEEERKEDRERVKEEGHRLKNDEDKVKERPKTASVLPPLTLGADVSTPLMAAVCGGDTHQVQLLLNARAEVNARDKNGFTALMLAANMGSRGLEKMLPEATTANATGHPVAREHPVAFGGKLDQFAQIVGILVAAGANLEVKIDRGHTALTLAARTGNAVAVKTLVDAKANMGVCNVGGNTALHEAILAQHEDVVQVLLEAKADANGLTATGVPALSAALKYDTGSMTIPELLVEAKADVNMVDKQGRTGLHYVCEFEQGYLVDLLVEAGADLEARNARGNTPLMVAVGEGDEDANVNVNVNVNVNAYVPYTTSTSPPVNTYRASN